MKAAAKVLVAVPLITVLCGFGNGSYAIGSGPGRVPTGSYAAPGGATCAWSTVDSKGRVLAHGSGRGRKQIAIPSGASAFRTSGCGEWSKVAPAIPTSVRSAPTTISPQAEGFLPGDGPPTTSTTTRAPLTLTTSVPTTTFRPLITTPQTAPLTTTTSTTATPTIGGSRTSPAPIGTTFKLRNWNVTVASYQPDATSAVLAANRFNSPPAIGGVYSLVRVRATYMGTGKASGFLDLKVGYVGSDSRMYVDYDCHAVTPDPFSFQPQVFVGGTIEGHECFELPAAVAGSGAVFVEDSSGYPYVTAWWR